MLEAMEFLATFAAETAGLDREAFLAQHPHGVLLLDPRKGRVERTGAFKHLLPQVLLAGVLEEDLETLKSEAAMSLVLPVAKTKDRRFPHLITLGRGPECDLVVDNPSVSKLHLFFNHDRDNGVYTVVDSKSTNGTILDNLIVSTIVPAQLKSGAELILGKAFRSTFNEAEDFFEFMDVLRKTGRL